MNKKVLTVTISALCGVIVATSCGGGQNTGFARTGSPVDPNNQGNALDFHWAFWADQPALQAVNIVAETQNVTGHGKRWFEAVNEFRNFDGIIDGAADFNNSETKATILDGNPGTRWRTNTPSPWWVVFGMRERISPRFYYITSANDAEARDPGSWVLYGRNDRPVSNTQTGLANWTEIHSVTNFIFDGRNQQAFFEIPEAARNEYQYFRLQITARRDGATDAGMMQFANIGFVEDKVQHGVDPAIVEPYLFPQIMTGRVDMWGGNRPTMNGSNALLINGNVATGEGDIYAKSYTNIRSGLNIPVNGNARLGYMFAPEGRQPNAGSNDFDFKLHSNHMAIDLLFSDGTRLSQLTKTNDKLGTTGPHDQYGIGMHPIQQGQGKVHFPYMWNYVEVELGRWAAGKTITDILVGFEMPNATGGHKVASWFDDIRIFDCPFGGNYSQIEFADFVDIRQGTNSATAGMGAIIPSITLPFATQYMTPTTTRTGGDKYQWHHTTMHGFTTSHAASRHMGEELTFLFMTNATLNTATATDEQVNDAINNSAAGFTHFNEFKYHNYHYGVTFNEDDARAPGASMEYTPTLHGGVFRFTWPAGSASRNIIFAAPHSVTENFSGFARRGDDMFYAFCQTQADDNARTNGRAFRRKHQFGQFSQTPSGFYTPASSSINTIVSFPDIENGPNGETIVEMRVAMSWMNEAQAKSNFGQQLFGLNVNNIPENFNRNRGLWFKDISPRAKSEWNKVLSTIKINDPTANYWELVNFYSKLQRSFLYPTLLSEYTGIGETGWQYSSPYRGTNIDPIIMDGVFIYNEGWWDTFKSKWPLMGFLLPNRTGPLTDGIVLHYSDQDGLNTSTNAAGISTLMPKAPMTGSGADATHIGHSVPRWINPGGNNLMTGTSSDAVIADMFAGYGVVFDAVTGYNAWIKNASVVTPNTAYGGRTGQQENTFLGFTPWGATSPAGGGGQLDATWALEGYINDAAQVHMLKKMAANVPKRFITETHNEVYWARRFADEAIYYENRAKGFVHHFDSSKPDDYHSTTHNETVSFSSGWFNNRNRDGSFRPLNPLSWGQGWTEDNAVPYRFLAPQDGRGLANLLGNAMKLSGREAMRAALNEAFCATDGAMDYIPGGYGGWIHEGTSKRAVMMGHFGLSNQPAYHMPWMYLFSDEPWQTQYWTRVAGPRAFSGEAIGHGYMGEEDNGAFASWYVFAAIGLYPLDLGSGTLVIGSPRFRDITITNDRGKKTRILAHNNSYENVYIQSIRVNGQPYNKLYITKELLQNDLTIEYVMGPAPNRTLWDANSEPPSLTSGEDVPNVLVDLTFEGIPVVSGAIPENLTTATVIIESANIPLTGNGRAFFLFDNITENRAARAGADAVATQDGIFTGNTATITYFNPDAPKLEMYTLTSRGADTGDLLNSQLFDANPNTPKTWTLYGSNDGKEWVVIDERKDEIFEWRRYTRPFAITPDKQGKYKYYRLNITDLNGAGPLALGQIEFLAGAARR
jgi:putative alpha-1,2-mannosidase